MHFTLDRTAETSGSPRSTTVSRRVLISGGLAAGGMQTHVALLCALLRQAGAEVTIASASSAWKPEELARVRALGVGIKSSPFGLGRWQLLGKAWAMTLWPLTLRRDFDVLYCVGEGRMHFWAGRFIRNGGFKIFHEIVECFPDVWSSGPLAGQMNGLIANSARVSRQLAGHFPGLPIRTIPFCTASGPLPPPPPRPALGARELRIAYLGRLVPHKRPLELVEVFAALHAHAPLAPARLDIYGADQAGLTAAIESKVEQAGLRGCVALHGAYTREDLERILASTDLVVLPSRYEGLPLVLVEAMQRGIPVVSTSAGGSSELGVGNPDVVISPGTGMEEFAAALHEMATRLRAGLIDSRRLHAWTEARYGYDTVAQTWREALLSPEAFFAAEETGEGRA